MSDASNRQVAEHSNALIEDAFQSWEQIRTEQTPRITCSHCSSNPGHKVEGLGLVSDLAAPIWNLRL